MVEVRLHGPLASFGRVWSLDIATPREAIAAIEANVGGFRRKIAELARAGMVFRVRSKDHDYGNEDVGSNLGEVSRIDIIPIIVGAGAGVRFVIGAVLVAAAFTPLGAPLAPYLIPIGLSLMVGSVAEWLTPKVKHDDNRNSSLQSWSINGPTNTVDQGLPVPVIYGEVLTGGYTISGGISASQLINGSLGASALIGGTSEVSDATGVGGDCTSRLDLGVGPFNMLAPFTYAWTYSGFAGAAAVRLTKINTATVHLEVDFAGLAVDTVTTRTGTLFVTVTGKNTDNSGASVSASTSRVCSLSINTQQYQGSTGS